MGGKAYSIPQGSVLVGTKRLEQESGNAHFAGVLPSEGKDRVLRSNFIVASTVAPYPSRTAPQKHHKWGCRVRRVTQYDFTPYMWFDAIQSNLIRSSGGPTDARLRFPFRLTGDALSAAAMAFPPPPHLPPRRARIPGTRGGKAAEQISAQGGELP